MWITDNVANRKWIISPSIDEESNNVTLTTNNLLGLSSNVMTLDASELKHGNPEEFASTVNVDNEGNWGMPNQGFHNYALTSGFFPTFARLPSNTSIRPIVRLVTLSNNPPQPQSPDYSPNNPPQPQSPDYSPNNPSQGPQTPSYSPNNPPENLPPLDLDNNGNPIIKIKTISEEKKRKDQQEMPMLNNLDDGEKGDMDDEFDFYNPNQSGGSGGIKKLIKLKK